MAEAACCQLAEVEVASRSDRLRWALARLPLDSDADAVHDVRVSLRQLRGAAVAFEGCLTQPRRWARRLRRAERGLGPLRDAEVRQALLQEVLGPVAVALDRGDDPRLASAAEGLVAAPRGRLRPGLRGLETEARRALAESTELEIATARERALAQRSLRRLGQASRPPQRVAQPPTSEPRELARRQLPSLFRRAARSAHGEVALHRRRGAIRRLRYRIELLSSILDPGAAVVLQELRELQALLGRLHDLAVLASWIDGSAQELRHELRPALRRLALRVELEKEAAREVAELELARLDGSGWWSAASLACLAPDPPPSA